MVSVKYVHQERVEQCRPWMVAIGEVAKVIYHERQQRAVLSMCFERNANLTSELGLARRRARALPPRQRKAEIKEEATSECRVRRWVNYHDPNYRNNRVRG